MDPQNHHTITKSFLKGFSTNDYVYYYDKIDRFKKIKYNHISTVPVIKDFYTWSNNDGTKDYSVEKFLGQIVEQDIGLLIREIENDYITLYDKKKATHLADFLSFLPVRTSLFKEKTKTVTPQLIEQRDKILRNGVNKTREELRLKGFEPVDKKIETHLEKLIDDWTKDSKDDNYFLKTMLTHRNKWYEVIINKNWHIMKLPPHRDFLLSDNPFYIQNSPYTEDIYKDIIPIPLSKNIALVLAGKGNDLVYHYLIDPKKVREIQFASTSRYHRYIISHSKRLLERSLKRLKIEY